MKLGRVTDLQLKRVTTLQHDLVTTYGLSFGSAKLEFSVSLEKPCTLHRHSAILGSHTERVVFL